MMNYGKTQKSTEKHRKDRKKFLRSSAFSVVKKKDIGQNGTEVFVSFASFDIQNRYSFHSMTKKIT